MNNKINKSVIHNQKKNKPNVGKCYKPILGEQFCVSATCINQMQKKKIITIY